MLRIPETEESIIADKPIITFTAKAKGKAVDTTKSDEDDLEEVPKKGVSKNSEDEDDDVEVEDDWEKADDELDPDFEEFDLPQSKKGDSKKGEEEDDIKIEDDEEFKDLFNEGSSFDDEDDEL